MKKIILITVISILILCIGVGCSTSKEGIQKSEINNLETQNSEDQNSEDIITAVTTAEWPYYETLRVLTGSCKNIIIGKVQKVLPAVRIDNIALGLVSTGDSKDELWSNVTRCEVEVLESLKGSMQKGITINIDQNGGNVDNIEEYTEDMPFLKEGSTYIIFIYEPRITMDNKPYFIYMAGAPYDGYPEIVDGKIVPHENSNFLRMA